MGEIQVFLPFADFAETARVLDRRRLGKQRVEVLQIVQANLGARLITRRFRGMEFNRTGQRIPVYEELAEQEWTVERVSPERRTWASHTVSKMWAPHLLTLLDYQAAICKEWVCVRGHKDSCWGKTCYLYNAAYDHSKDKGRPWWLGDERLHSSHRAALLFKNWDHYSQFGWSESPAYDYFWPEAV